MATSSIYHESLLQAARNAYDMPLVALTKPHDSHPSLGHLVLLVFEAVLEVVCVSLPGYIVARLGHFDVEKQKFLANLNVMLFTPCLIFTKLASQLTPNKLVDLAIIPLIFAIQMSISFVVARLVSKAFGFNKRASNFVTAMGVFGNSNSLPISLVLSLSQTLKGLHWDKIPGDNDDDVGARGILYLLIFQQLGQLVRWSWGYHVLLAPKEKYPEYAQHVAEEGEYRDDDDNDATQTEGVLIAGLNERFDRSPSSSSGEDFDDRFEPAGRTPVTAASRASPVDSEDEADNLSAAPNKKPRKQVTALHGHNIPSDSNLLPSPAMTDGGGGARDEAGPGALKKWLLCCKSAVAARLSTAFQCLPGSIQTALKKSAAAGCNVYRFLWSFMNPPLWAMLVAIVVASVPALKELFFEEGSFVKNSVTSAIRSNGGVAVPLILVVLGANLANNTKEQGCFDEEEHRIGKKLLIASLVSRMVLPTLIMAPVLAVIAKYINVSILDDPIFIIVCFLLTGAPSALQLAQICQINNVYETVMSKILFQSYVIWILPSTLLLVMCALEVVEWAKPL